MILEEKWEEEINRLKDEIKGRDAVIRHLNIYIEELETDLSLNTSMLARQCDLSREAEIKANKYYNACNDLNETITELEDLISEAAQMAWIAHHDMEGAHEWEKKAFELIGGKAK